MSIIFGIIAKDSKPLCEYSEYIGSISTVCIKAIPMCKEIQGVLTYEGYNMYYEKKSNLIFMLMCEKDIQKKQFFNVLKILLLNLIQLFLLQVFMIMVHSIV